jgi:hypothetical protein
MKRGDDPHLYYGMVLVGTYQEYLSKHGFSENLLRPREVIDKELENIETYQSLYASGTIDTSKSLTLPEIPNLHIPAISVVSYEDAEKSADASANAANIEVNPTIAVDAPVQIPAITIEAPQITMPPPEITVNVPTISVPQPTVFDLPERDTTPESRESVFSSIPKEYSGGSPRLAFEGVTPSYSYRPPKDK